MHSGKTGVQCDARGVNLSGSLIFQFAHAVRDFGRGQMLVEESVLTSGDLPTFNFTLMDSFVLARQ